MMGPPITAPSRVLGGFPEKMRTTLRYTTNIVLTSTTGAVAYYDFRGNGPYDPDATSTGGQPANYDDLALHYDFYRVYGSRISVIACHGSNSNVPGQLALFPNDGHVPTRSPLSYAAQPFALIGVVSNTSNPLTLTSRMTTSRIMGQSAVQVAASEELAAAVTTVPTQQWTWSMAWQPIDQSSTLIAQTVVVLDYDVEFYEREPGDLDYIIERAQIMKKKRQEFDALKGTQGKIRDRGDEKEGFMHADWTNLSQDHLEVEDRGDEKCSTRAEKLNSSREKLLRLATEVADLPRMRDTMLSVASRKSLSVK